MTYGDVAKIGSFAVPASTIEVTPSEGQPGDMVYPDRRQHAGVHRG